MLGENDLENFLEKGFVVVRKAFSREVAEQLLPYVWSRAGIDPNAPETWKTGHTQIEEVITEGPVAKMFTERYRQSVNRLAGQDRWHTKIGFGWVILRLPDGDEWYPPISGWHVDGIDFQHHVTSPEQGLVGIEMLSDIQPGGGGTAVRVGSHKFISRLLSRSEPHGISYLELRKICDAATDFPVEEITGEAGDLLWMHPHLIHARSPNTQKTIRVAANRCIALHAPMVIEGRTEEEYSLVERAIRLALA